MDESTPEGNWKILTVLGAMSLGGMIATMTVEAAIDTAIFLLPPYSPDLNPIEKAWSRLKELLRSAKARTVPALEAALAQLLPEIKPSDANAWFRLVLGPLYMTS